VDRDATPIQATAMIAGKRQKFIDARARSCLGSGGP